MMQEGIILRKYRTGLLAINNLRGGFIRALGRVIPKGHKRSVILSCVLWSIRNLFPEPGNKYVLYEEGKKD